MPDFEVPSIYLRKNFHCDDRLAIVLIDRGSGEVRQKFATAEKIASAPFQAHLRAANASGKDVYISMNTVAPPHKGGYRDHPSYLSRYRRWRPRGGG